MKFSKFALLAFMGLSLNTYSFAAPRLYKDGASCNIQIHDVARLKKTPPERVFGTATSKHSQLDACNKAKKDAMRKAPDGTYPRHCYCDSNKR